ncbi:MAG: succinate dehydrogenase assembly factor 2 [Alphaproteobacteria bacterium]|nr:succinate dehydrogenase assembly factor 2 [Alphaproteobacteria bacterium]
MIETPEIRLKRLKMRSWRRGMKEMDLILGPFSDTGLAALSAHDLDLYEDMLDENDQELYRWFSGQVDAPTRFFTLVEHLKAQTSFC